MQVENRGSQPATAVTVNMWTIAWSTAPTNPPKWDRTTTTWSLLTTPAPQTIPAGAARTFSFSGVPTGPGRLVLADATSVADRSNIDLATTRPTATKPTPIVDLVAGDNNLGLRLL